jgi:uncharacterized membrane protein
MLRHVGQSIRNNMIVGLILIIPIAVTGFIVNFLFRTTTKWVINFVPKPWLDHHPAILFQAAALVIVLIVLFFIGLLTRNFFGKRLYQFGDMILGRIPFINKIYLSIRQISEAIVDQSQTMFKEVVMVEYPRKGLFSLGFVTASVPRYLSDLTTPNEPGKDLIAVFIATAPNPTSGFFIFIPKSEVIVMPLTVADAMRLVVSAGAVYPGTDSIDNRPTLLDKLETWIARDGSKTEPKNAAGS